MSVRYRIIGRTYYGILCDKLPFTYPFIKDGRESDIIALYNNKVCVIRDRDYVKEIFTLDDVRNEYDRIFEKRWVNEDVKNSVIDYYKNLINLTVSYQREFKIDELLNKYDINWVALAC